MVPSRPHQGGGCSTVPPLDVTHSASSQLPHSLSLSVTLLLHTPSHALYLHLSLSGSFSPLFYIPPSLYASLELSPLSCFFFCIRHVSVFPLFPNFFARRPQLTPPLPHQLRVFFQTKTIQLSLFVWACLFLLPFVLGSLGFSQSSCQPLIFILPVVSHIPFLMRPNLCSSPSLMSFFLSLSLPNVPPYLPSPPITCLPCFASFSLFHHLSLFGPV